MDAPQFPSCSEDGALKEIVLSVERLTVYRETCAAVEDVSFSLVAGTDTAIVGSNGAGKSTLVQAILGILPRQSGQIWVLGHSLSPRGFLPMAIRQQVAYLPQNFLFDRRIPITVEELVSLGWNRSQFQWPWHDRSPRTQAVHEALRRVEALHLKSQLVSGLSGGETKRVLLAYCLVRPRRILVLDEAPSGLDLRSESDFYQRLHELKQEQGWTILQISHDLQRVRQHCDRVLCLNRRILCQGIPDVTLSADMLGAIYGSGLINYQHQH